MAHLRPRQKAYCVTPKIQNQTGRRRKEPWWNSLLCLCAEALGKSGRRQTATFVIMRSGGCNKRRTLPPGSKRLRLCLACQAVKNMFTSGGRMLVGRSRVSREEIYRRCKFLYAGICIKKYASSRGALLFFFVDCFLTDRVTSWPEVYWGRAVRCVCYF